MSIGAVLVSWSGVGEFFEALVDFDAWDNAFCGEKIDEILPVVGELACGFVEEDDAVDIVFEIGGSKEDVAVIATVFVSVWNAELVEFFVDATARFVGGKDAFGS